MYEGKLTIIYKVTRNVYFELLDNYYFQMQKMTPEDSLGPDRLPAQISKALNYPYLQTTAFVLLYRLFLSK